MSIDIRLLELFLMGFPIFRSSLQNLITKFLYDGPVNKPQRCSAWYHKKITYLKRELAMIRQTNEMKKEECSHYIKKWVCSFEFCYFSIIFSKQIFLLFFQFFTFFFAIFRFFLFFFDSFLENCFCVCSLFQIFPLFSLI